MDYARNPSPIPGRIRRPSKPFKPYNRSHMQPAQSTRVQDGFMAAMRLEGEKPHQGLAGRNPAPNQVREVRNFTVLLGMRGQAELNRVGSCCTGKERDTESGNDYFEARYYSSAMGRFLSPDWSAKVEPVPYSKLDDPQSLNLYAYVQNNPLTRFDVDGHDFIILNDSQAVHGEGHNAAIVGNDKSGGWNYYSKNGYGTSGKDQPQHFDSLADFQKSDSSKRYDRGARVETTEKQDGQMKEAGDKNISKPYSVVATHNADGSTKAENCADLTATIGQAGGVKIDKPETTASGLGGLVTVSAPATNPNQQFGGVVVNNNVTPVQPHIEEKKPQ